MVWGKWKAWGAHARGFEIQNFRWQIKKRRTADCGRWQVVWGKWEA